MDIIIDISSEIIETERLILRGWKSSDLFDFFEYASVEGVGEMAGWKHHENIEKTKKILDLFMNDKNVFAVVYKKNNKVIGSLGLHYSWANDDINYASLIQKEIGYVLSKDYWGKGLMVEAVKAFIEYLFTNFNLDLVSISHFKFNNQSKRVIQKSGFQYVYEKEVYLEYEDRYMDNIYYILFNKNKKINDNTD